MQKTKERTQLETEIIEAHKNSLDIAMQMVQEEFSGDLEKALSDESFVSRMQTNVIVTSQAYRQGYKRLEELERNEGYPAMGAYAEILDEIAQYLPEDRKETCHYPYSGIDFYWARIFKKVIFEDTGFDQRGLPSMWWDPEMYSARKRGEIIGILEAQRIMPKFATVEFSSGDSDAPSQKNQLNNLSVTLLVKGGHDFLGYVESGFGESTLRYGAIITVTAANPPEAIEKRLSEDGYRREVSLEGTDYLTPFAMELKDIHIFIKPGAV